MYNSTKLKIFFSTVSFVVSFLSTCSSISLIASLKIFCWFKRFFVRLLIRCDWLLRPFQKSFLRIYTVWFLGFFMLSCLLSIFWGRFVDLSDNSQFLQVISNDYSAMNYNCLNFWLLYVFVVILGCRDLNSLLTGFLSCSNLNQSFLLNS